MWQGYRKALAPAALALLAVIVTYVIDGEWDRLQTAVAFTAFIAAGQVAIVPNLPDSGIWRYLKPIVPAFATFMATVALWIETGEFNEEELGVFLTGAGTALIAAFLANGGKTNEVGSFPVPALGGASAVSPGPARYSGSG